MGVDRAGTHCTGVLISQPAGITGEVVIDTNGDRVASYSLLDMNPESSKFEVVATYVAANSSLSFVEGRTIHWAGGRLDPPPDTPRCGFDGSLCPNTGLLSLYCYFIKIPKIPDLERSLRTNK